MHCFTPGFLSQRVIIIVGDPSRERLRLLASSLKIAELKGSKDTPSGALNLKELNNHQQVPRDVQNAAKHPPNTTR